MTHDTLSIPDRDKKYILQLCHGYGMPFHDVARQYAALFQETGYKVVTVFLTGKKSREITEAVQSDDVIFLENSSKDIRGLKLKQIRQVRLLHHKYNFAFCIAHRFKPIYIACHLSGLFVVGVHHAFGGYKRWGRRWFVQNKQAQLALLGVSDAIRDDIRTSLPKFSSDRVQTLYNRIDLEQARASLLGREEARVGLGICQDKFIFGNVGRLHPDKDQATLIKAFALVHKSYPEAVLVIMGKGRLETELKALSIELGLEGRVIFTGAVKEGARYFKAFDTFVLSSNNEPFGMVLLEAMAAEVPVIVCDSGGAPEVYGDHRALFPLGDTKGLAQRMEDYLHLGQAEKQVMLLSMNQRLTDIFSDNAVKRVFWNLPFLLKWKPRLDY